MRNLVIAIAFFFATIVGRATHGVEYVFEEILVPDSLSTGVNDINNLGQYVGTYRNPDSSSHAYVFGGTGYATLDVPGAEYTVPTEINDLGVIAGFYVFDGKETGFVYQEGEFTTIALDKALGTRLWGINNNGEIVGSYASVDHVEIGFAISPTGALRELFGQNGQHVIPTAIANDGTILGRVVISPEEFPPRHGGVLISGSTYTELPQFDHSLEFSDLNDSDAIVGYTGVGYSPFGQAGFVVDDGVYSSFRYPGSRHTLFTGVNNSGTLVGSWLSPDGSRGGAFLARPVPEPSALALAVFGTVGIAAGLLSSMRNR